MESSNLMIEPDEQTLLAAARAGDHDAFEHLIDPYRRELLVHCYRMLGSLEDADDAMQETLLRAWRKLDSFEGRAPLRAWLYKIATNAALDALSGRRPRVTPIATFAPAEPNEPLPGPIHEAIWLEPLPDELVDLRVSANPEARYEARESVTLAFLSVLQYLPGRQRAVLILRDVLGYGAGEVATILDMTTVAVNSALQRARATMQQRLSGRAEQGSTATRDEQTASLLSRYVQAWEAPDANVLVALLREDATLSMPPIPAWYRGRADIGEFLTRYIFNDARARYRLLPTRANGCPAFALYQDTGLGQYRPAALHVLTLASGQIAELDDFLVSDERLFVRFGLPALI